MMPNHLPLVREFPSLRFAQKADEWLQWAKGATLFEQLDDRRIIKIDICPLGNAKSTLSPEEKSDGDGGCFYVCINQFSKKHRFMESLGREIGHTFQFNLSHNPPEKRSDIHCDDTSLSLYEEFFDEFARKFLAINTKEKVQADCQEKGDDLFVLILLMFSDARKTERILARAG